MQANQIRKQLLLIAMIIDIKEEKMNSFIKKSWEKIAPFWSLKNLIAINPLKGFEDLPFEKALQEAQIYFQQKDLPAEEEKKKKGFQCPSTFYCSVKHNNLDSC